MSKRTLLTLYFVCWLTIAFAQHGWKFHPSAFEGLSQGDLGATALVKVDLTFTHGPWSLGPGTGIDYYRFRSVPLFLSATRDLSSPQSICVFFVYLDAGLNLPWYNPHIPNYYTTYSSNFHPGSWFSAGPGFRCRLSRNHPQALLLTAGYTNKRLKEIQTSRFPCSTPMSCMYSPESYTNIYINHILVLAIGLRF